MHMRRSSAIKKFLVIALVYSVLICLCACNTSDKIQYYSQKENYICVTGTISSIKYNEDNTAVYIDFSELTPILDDTCFKIVGENLAIVQTNKINDKLKANEKVTFITAPKYFGDGYVMPIVALSINGEDLLTFEEGYQNWLDWLSK